MSVFKASGLQHSGMHNFSNFFTEYNALHSPDRVEILFINSCRTVFVYIRLCILNLRSVELRSADGARQLILIEKTEVTRLTMH